MGKTIAIIGYGNTGPAFARKLSGFGVKVIAYDKYKHNISDKYCLEATWDYIWEHADILSLHIPLTDETNYLVNEEFINKFRKPVILVNTSRGQIVNTKDLVTSIKNGKITAACLDVNEYEDNSFNKLNSNLFDENWAFITSSPKVVLTPHIAGQSSDSMKRHAEILARKILHLFNL